MNHEYRESPSGDGTCAGCGRPYPLCVGEKPVDLSFLKARPNPNIFSEPRMTLAGPPSGKPTILDQPWDAWCKEHGIDPNTPDETLLDDYLHNRQPKARPNLQWAWTNAQALADEIIGLARMPAWRDDHQQAAYASWADYDAELERLPAWSRRLHARAEVATLTAWWRL